MKKRAAPRIAAGAAVLLLAFSGIPASALSPGQSYVYDAFSPAGVFAGRLYGITGYLWRDARNGQFQRAKPCLLRQ